MFVQTENKNAFIILGALTFIFLSRVLAQLIQYVYPIDSLPAFDSWQSGTLSYTWLLFTQIMILTLQISVLVNMYKGTYIFYQRRGKAIYIFGIIYFGLSIVRLILGSVLLNDHEFWGATIPSIFHVFLVFPNRNLIVSRFYFFQRCRHFKIPPVFHNLQDI